MENSSQTAPRYAVVSYTRADLLHGRVPSDEAVRRIVNRWLNDDFEPIMYCAEDRLPVNYCTIATSNDPTASGEPLFGGPHADRRGAWLIAPLNIIGTTKNHNRWRTLELVAHSMIEDADGKWIEMTNLGDDQRFIICDESAVWSSQVSITVHDTFELAISGHGKGTLTKIVALEE